MTGPLVCLIVYKWISFYLHSQFIYMIILLIMLGQRTILHFLQSACGTFWWQGTIYTMYSYAMCSAKATISMT